MKNPVKHNIRPHNFKDLTGFQFGRLIVSSHAGSELVQKLPKPKYKALWKVICSCGTNKIVRGSDLGKKVVSCGCHKVETTIKYNINNKTKVSYCTFSAVWQSYKSGAKKRNLRFELTKEEFLTLTLANCYYCGEAPKGTRKSRSKGNIASYIYNGIDRKDNNSGYNKDNCVPCCKYCNYAKRDTPIDVFLNNIKKIYQKHFS